MCYRYNSRNSSLAEWRANTYDNSRRLVPPPLPSREPCALSSVSRNPARARKYVHPSLHDANQPSHGRARNFPHDVLMYRGSLENSFLLPPKRSATDVNVRRVFAFLRHVCESFFPYRRIYCTFRDLSRERTLSICSPFVSPVPFRRPTRASFATLYLRDPLSLR